MPLLVYRPNPTDHTHENEEFRKVCKVLKRKFAQSEQLCVLAGNMNVYGKEYDAFMIMPSSVILLEFKDYGGHIIAAENGPWLAQNGEQTATVKGGSSRKNPFDQARTNRSTFMTALIDAGINEEAARKLVALVLFHKPITLDNHISEPVQRWLHIADVDHLHEKVDDIVNPSLDLQNEDILHLLDSLHVEDSFLDREYSDVKFFNGWRNIEEDIAVEIPQEVLKYVEGVHKIKKVTAPFAVLDCLSQRPNVSFDIIRRYLVRIDAEPNEEMLSRFNTLGIDAFSDGEKLYWALGDLLEVPLMASCNNAQMPTARQLSFRKSDSRLPVWLENYLYSDLSCVYAPDHERYAYNADLTPEEVLVYAGTYFPRSFAESFIIFDNLLSNQKFKSSLLSNETITLFSLGSGSGGDTLGIIAAIDKHNAQADIPIKVIAVDENEPSLDFFENAIHQYMRHSRRIVSFKKQCVGIRTLEQLGEISNKIDNSSINIFSCSKMGCELASHDILAEYNPYEIILETFKNKIHRTGVASIVDVTTPTQSGLFIPQLLNAGINAFVSNNPQFATLIPQSCGCYERECAAPCFFQQEIKVHHCKKFADVSRICYRIIADKLFCDKVNDGNVGQKYIIGRNDDGSYSYCQHSLNNDNEIDAFNVNN